MKPPQKTRADALEEEEILGALAASGYPLEIRLLRAFSDGGMDPIIGFRIASGPTESREVDIIAHFTRNIPVGDGRVLRVTLRLLVEAKSMEPGSAFVGFPWKRPTEHELRVGRARFGGLPSYRIVRGFDQPNDVVIGKDGIADAFDPLNEAPVCVQWATVRRTKSGNEQRPVATHDDSFWDDIDGVVRASRAMMVSHTTHPWPKGTLMMLFEVPVLVVATPQLWLHEPAATPPPSGSNLTSTHRLVLDRMFQLDHGVEQRLVDVVTEAGLPAFIESCRKTVEALEARVQRHAGALIEAAESQHESFEKLRIEAAMDDFQRRRNPFG